MSSPHYTTKYDDRCHNISFESLHWQEKLKSSSSYKKSSELLLVIQKIHVYMTWIPQVSLQDSTLHSAMA